jgi:hypothetical protein
MFELIENNLLRKFVDCDIIADVISLCLVMKLGDKQNLVFYFNNK